MSALPIAPEAYERSRFFGSSDIAALLGISPYRNAVDLFLDKIDPRPDDGRNAKAKARGTRLEPYLRDMIADEFGVKIVRHSTRYVDPGVPFFAAEVDAETEDENIELKTASPFMQKQWGDEETDQVPIAYAAQVQWALGITDKPRCRVYALIGDDLRQYVVERDDETINAMRQKAAAFWRDNVLAGKVPDIDVEHERAIDTLKRLYPGTDGTVLPASQAMESWRDVLEDSQELVKQYESAVDVSRAHLLSLMKTATAIEFADGRAFTRKVVQRKAFTTNVAAASYVLAKIGKLKGIEA